MPSIKDLMAPGLSGRTIKIKYIDDFEIEIRYLPRSEMRKIGEKATEYYWDQKDHTRKEKTNSEKFYKDFIPKVFVGWSGLTLRTLAKFLFVEGDNPEMEIPYSEESAMILMQNGYNPKLEYQFDLFIQNVVMDIEKFQSEKREDEIKNL